MFQTYLLICGGKKCSELAFSHLFHVVVGLTLEGHNCSAHGEDHVSLDLHGFYKLSPAVKLVFSFFFSSVQLETTYSDFSAFFKKAHCSVLP